MENWERIDCLNEATEQLYKAIDNIKDALRGTSHEGHANAYILPHLRSWIDSDNRFNMGIQQYIDRLDEEDEEEDEEFED
jgi:hypothetical protein